MVAVTRDQAGTGYIRLLVVNRDHRSQGHGTELLGLAQAELSDTDTIVVGGDAPHYLYPGVDVRSLEMMSLLEKGRFRRCGVNLNLRIAVDDLPDVDCRGVQMAGSDDVDDVLAFATEFWPRFRTELLRAAARETLLVQRDRLGIAGFCAHSVSRKGWIGPAAVRPDLLGTGAGRPLLASAVRHAAELYAAQPVTIEWVGPLRPYVHMGAASAVAYVVYRREKDQGHPVDAKRRIALPTEGGALPEG